MSIFEKVSRLKIRFNTSKGLLTTEDLWDLPLRGPCSLDAIAVGLDRQLKEAGTVSFVDKAKIADEKAQLAFDIVKRVIEVRLEEADAAKQAKAKRELRQKLLQIKAEKQEGDLREKSMEDLDKMLAELE